MEGRMFGKLTKCRRRIQMLKDTFSLYESYEALKRTTEDESTWRKSNTKKTYMSTTCCKADS